MARVITKIEKKDVLPTQKRVAAYARVSCGRDEMLHSLAAQVKYYTSLIQSNPAWKFISVFADEAYTGTKANRPQFQQMLADCRAGKIDMIITKSISRFARNTITLLETVRELKGLGVDVWFEEQNLHSISADGELMLTILASYAQEESLSVSENCKWRIRNNYKEGIPNTFRILGYDFKKGNVTVNEQEAEIVKIIFNKCVKTDRRKFVLDSEGFERLHQILDKLKAFLAENGFDYELSVKKTDLSGTWVYIYIELESFSVTGVDYYEFMGLLNCACEINIIALTTGNFRIILGIPGIYKEE